MRPIGVARGSKRVVPSSRKRKHREYLTRFLKIECIHRAISPMTGEDVVLLSGLITC